MKRCNPSRWSWGLIPILLVAFIVVAGEGPKIEQELAQRSVAALEEQGYTWAQVHFLGRDGVLTGTAFSPEQRSAALETVSQIHGVSSVQDKAELLPMESPYIWLVTRSGDKLKIKGHVPTEEDHQTILGIIKATLPGLSIDDRMELASGAPPKQRWLGAISFALDQLGHLDRGSVQLTDMKLVITGIAQSEKAYKGIEETISSASLPTGLTLERYNVVPPEIDPYSWGVAYKDGTVKLSGHVPNEEMRNELLKNVAQAFSNASIEDSMSLGSGVPDGWSKAVMLAISQLARLDEGEVSVSGMDFRIEGMARDEETAKDVAKQLRESLPEDFEASDKIGTRKQSGSAEPSKSSSEGKPEKTMAQPFRPDAETNRRVYLWPRKQNRREAIEVEFRAHRLLGKDMLSRDESRDPRVATGHGSI